MHDNVLPFPGAVSETPPAPHTDNADFPPEGERWSTWDGATHGPKPRPDWVITDLGAVDAELGILKSGKEADVHLMRRWVPGTARTVTMAAKQYRPAERRLFHRDSGYLEGRRVRRSRETRAMARRTEFGREVIAGQWAGTEFGALGRLWTLGLPVPYPVQLSGTELVIEFIGDHQTGQAAPRLAATSPSPELLAALYDQFRDAMYALVEQGWTHGDLSAYNVLLDDERMVIIDWPQIVDIIGNPQGFEFLQRDVSNMCTWFAKAGHPVDADDLFGDLAALAAGA